MRRSLVFLASALLAAGAARADTGFEGNAQAGPAASPQAGVLAVLTPEMIEDVIATTGEEQPQLYMFRSNRVWLQFDTPRLRLAREVARARAQSLPAASHLATPEVIAPELRLVAGPEVYGDEDVEVKAVVIERADGSVVEPLSIKPRLEKAQSRRRKNIKLNGLEAVFPAAALTPDARFHVKMKKGPDQLLAPPAAWFAQPR